MRSASSTSRSWGHPWRWLAVSCRSGNRPSAGSRSKRAAHPLRGDCRVARRREVLGRFSVRTSRLGSIVLSPYRAFLALFWLFWCAPLSGPCLAIRAGGGLLMLQLLDLARENAALKRELARIRQEAEALQRLLQPSEGGPGPERVAPTEVVSDPSRELLKKSCLVP